MMFLFDRERKLHNSVPCRIEWDADHRSSLLRSVGVVVGGRHPVPVSEPDAIGDDLGAVVVPVPRVVGVRPVLDLQRRVPEARLPERRVARLRPREVIRDALDVAAVADGHVHGRAGVPHRRRLPVDDVVGDVGHAVAALVRVDVPGEHDVGPGVHEPFLELHPHRLPFHVVVVVAVVPRRVHQHHEPRRRRPVDPLELRLQPRPLRRVLAVGGVGGEHHDVRRGELHRVPERLRAPRGQVRRRVPVRVGLEGRRLPQLRREVQLVVPRRPDPRLVRRVPLHEAAPRVPPVVVVQRVVVRVREVADVEDGVAAVVVVVGERDVGVERLAKVACIIQSSLISQSVMHGQSRRRQHRQHEIINDRRTSSGFVFFFSRESHLAHFIHLESLIHHS